MRKVGLFVTALTLAASLYAEPVELSLGMTFEDNGIMYFCQSLNGDFIYNNDEISIGGKKSEGNFTSVLMIDGLMHYMRMLILPKGKLVGGATLLEYFAKNIPLSVYYTAQCPARLYTITPVYIGIKMEEINESYEKYVMMYRVPLMEWPYDSIIMWDAENGVPLYNGIITEPSSAK